MSLEEQAHASDQDHAVFVSTLQENKVQQEKLLSELSKATLGSQGWSFQTIFEDEVRRIKQFVDRQQERIELAAKALFVRAKDLASGPVCSVQESYAQVHELKRETQKIVDDCLALQNFFNSSRTTLFDTAATADGKLGQVVHCTSVVPGILPKTHLNSSLVCVVSDIYNALRQAEESIRNQNNGNGDGNALWQAPSSFQRSTTKYWVRNENLTNLMMACATEAPLLVYGKKGPLTSTNRKDLKLSEGDKLWDTLATRITSIYFDSDTMSLYQERIARGEGAQLLRARWYGPTMPTGEKIIFVEMKTHHEKWVAQKSIKERASIQEQDMIQFLLPIRWKKEDAQAMVLRGKPKLKGEELEKATGLLMRMHNLVVNHKLKPCVRTVYDRAAFQSAKSNDLRLTLDRNVTLVNERVQQPGDGQWCMNDEEAQNAPKSVVPFNVFEVKLAGDDPMPAALAQAEDDATIELAAKFSKFLTGAAAFNPVPILPYWAAHPAFYTFFQMDKRGTDHLQTTSTYSNNNAESNQQDDYNLMGTSNNSNSDDAMAPGRIPPGVVIAPKKPPRIEPKTFFAHERSYIQWISASIMLLNISGYLLGSGRFNKTVAVISFSALVLIGYSTHLYFKRLDLLKNRKPYGYFDKSNPIFLTSVVGLAIFLVWVDSVHGGDFLGLFTWSSKGGGSVRRMLRSQTEMSRSILPNPCPKEITSTKLLMEVNPNSLLVDSERHSFLTTSEQFVYIHELNSQDESDVSPKTPDPVIRVHDSHLQGLAFVGDRLFAVSDGPARIELVEMAWWGTTNEKLRIVGRWTLEDNGGHVDGFTFVPSSIDPMADGNFYINVNSSVGVYSVPARSQSFVPKRLKSLNMKALNQGMPSEKNDSNDHLSTMTTFEGITYILRSKKNVLEAWKLQDGTLVTEIELPVARGQGDTRADWTSFALERRMADNIKTGNVRGSDTSFSGALYLHLMVKQAAPGGQIWSYPVDKYVSGDIFFVPACQFPSASLN